MQSQNKIFKSLIKASINGLSEDQQNMCIQLLSKCQYNSILINILKLNTKNNGKDNIIQLINHTMQMIKQKQNICAFISYKFRITWLKIKIIEKIDMRTDGILCFLQKTKYVPFNGSIKEFIYRISKQFRDIEQEQSLMSKFEQQINKNENYHILKKIYPNKAEILQLERQEKRIFNFNKLQLMEQFKEQSSNSILDQLLQQNLFRAFQVQFCQGQNVQNTQIFYTNYNFQKFKKQLLHLITKIKLTDCQRQLKINSMDKQNYYYKILNIRNKIHPIYIPQLIFRTNKNSEMLIRKDVFALFGDTGVGKTTIAQILLGYTLIKCQNSSQLETLAPLNGLKAQHKDFKSNSTAESVTKYLTTAKLMLPQKYSDQGELYIADTPGNNDLNGISIDVANNIHTIKILKQTNSIRFGFVINEKKWGLRGEGFKSMALQISKFFIKYQQLKPIYFLNNFYQQEKLIQLIAKVNDLKQNGLNEEEKSNYKMVAIVNHFSKLMESTIALMKKQNITVRQAIKLNQQLILIDPRNPDLEQIYQKILSKQRQIQWPKDCIAFNFSRQVEQVFQFQSTNLKQITKYFICQNNAEAAIYYISQLKNLINITEGTNDVARAKLKLEQIITFVQNNFQKIIQKFKSLSGQILSLDIAQQLLRQAKLDKQILCKLQNKLKIIPEMEHFNYQQKVNKIIYQQITTMLQLKIKEQNLNIKHINTIKLFSNYFVPKLMLQLKKQIQRKKASIQNTINQTIKQQKYNCLQNLVKQLEYILSFKIDSQNSTLYNNSWRQNLKAQLELRNEKYLKIIDRYRNSLSFTITQRDTLYLKECCDIFNIKSSKIKQINQIYEHFVKIKKQTIQLAIKQYKALIAIILKWWDKNQKFQKQKAYKLKQNIEKIAKIQCLQNQINQMLQNISQLLVEKNIQSFEEFQTYFQIEIEQNLHKLKNYYEKMVDSLNFAALANKQQQIKILKLVQKHKKSLCFKIQQYFNHNIQPLATDLNISNRQLLKESLYAAKILSYIKPLSCSLRSQQTTKDDIQQLYQRMRLLLKQKLSKYVTKFKQLLQIVKGNNKQIKTAQQVRKICLDIFNIEKFLIIHKQFDMKQTYKILQIYSQFNNLIKQFQEQLNILVHNLQKIILSELQKIKKIMDDLNSDHHHNKLSRQYIKMISEQFQLVQNIKSRRQLQAILRQKTDFAYIYNKNIKQIKILIDQKIEKVIKKQKNNYIIQIFIHNCKMLKFLNQQIFKDSLNQIQKIISEYKQKIDLNLRNLIRDNGSIDYYVLINLYEDILSFGQNGIFVTKKQMLVLKLKQYMRRQEQQIKICINKVSVKQFEDKLQKIYELYEKTVQVNKILKQNYFSISSQTITKIKQQHSANLYKIKKKINNIQKFQKQNKKNQLQHLYQQYYHLFKSLNNKQWKHMQISLKQSFKSKQWKHIQISRKQTKNNFTLCWLPNYFTICGDIKF